MYKLITYKLDDVVQRIPSWHLFLSRQTQQPLAILNTVWSYFANIMQQHV